MAKQAQKIITRYESVAALGEAASGATGVEPFSMRDCGQETKAAAIEYARHGNDKLVAKAEAMIDDYMLEIDTSRVQWVDDVAGAFPMVPAFLAGAPDCMRRRALVESDIAPITILFNTACSHKCNAETIMKRGTAVLAFVFAMRRIRPISLHIYSACQAYDREMPEHILIAEVNSTPLDVATAAYTLTSSGFFRRLMYLISSEKSGGVSVNWPYGWQSDRAKYNAGLLESLNLDPANTVLIDGAFSGDQLISDPEGWLKDQIAKFTAQQAEAA